MFALSCLSIGGVACADGDDDTRRWTHLAHESLIQESSLMFDWLPPVVRRSPPLARLDTDANPRVELDELAVDGSTIRRVATFSRTTGRGSERIRSVGQAFVLKWPTRSANLDPDRTYRIRVFDGAVELGLADLDVVPSQRDLKRVDRANYVPLVRDQALTLRFRITKVSVPPPRDADADGIDDETDNCPAFANADQMDADADGIGDACECADVLCPSLDICHRPGTCDPRSGTCTDGPLADGTPCDDGSACTRDDACQAGSCTGVTACGAKQLCMDGACVPHRCERGAFTEVGRHPVHWQPTAVIASDVDADGQPDLLVTSVYEQTLNVLFADGSGGFAPVVRYGTGGYDGSFPMSMSAADVDANGTLDLAVANPGSDSLAILLNRGGGFGLPTDYDAGRWGGYFSTPTQVALADLNQDGAPDMIAANATSASIVTFVNDGSGLFAPAINFESGGASGTHANLAARDFDGDGRVDVALLNAQDAHVRLFTNAGGGNLVLSGVFSTLGILPSGLAAADVNADGRVDLAVANHTGPNSIVTFINDGFGSFSGPVLQPIEAQLLPETLAAADFDGDGLQDLITTNWGSGDVTIFYNEGAGSFAEPLRLTSVYGPKHSFPADLDGDGDADLAVVNAGDATLSVLRNECVR